MSKLLPKYAHSTGRTNLAYSNDSRFLFSVGSDRLIRKFTVGSTDEPKTIEHHDGDILAVAASKTHFATCSEDGTVSLFDINTNDYKGLITRSSLPIREIAFSPDGTDIAVASDDDTSGILKIVNVNNIIDTTELEIGSTGGVKHVSYSPSGQYLSVSCGDGSIRIFDLITQQCAYTYKDMTPRLRSLGEDICTKLLFHPSGNYFAVPTKLYEIAVYSKPSNPPTQIRLLKDGHTGPITDFKWSPNGLYICSSGPAGQLAVWNVELGEIVVQHQVSNTILFVDWHPSANVLSFTTDQGQLYTLTAPVPTNQPLPYGKIHELKDKAAETEQPIEYDEVDENDMGGDLEEELERTANVNGYRKERSRTTSVEPYEEQQEDWIEDDDGAGYVSKTAEKRPGLESHGRSKRHRSHHSSALEIRKHEPFQPGATPWRNDRRYMCMNLLGYVWTVKQADDHNTITVSFFDRDMHREFHFTDYNDFDLACLSEQACLLASTKTNKIFLRFHDGYNDSWEHEIEETDSVRAISLSDSLVVVITANGYIQTFNIYGTPIRIRRQSQNPPIACTSWGDTFMLVNASTSDNSLTYTVQDGKSDQSYQKDDTLDIANGKELTSIFFSENGDPCIFDSDGLLLILLHWRDPMQARWIPILSSKELAGERKESYWPLGLANDDKFHCVIMKDGEKYPKIPLPLSAEFELAVPLNTKETIEKQYLTFSTLYELLKDRLTVEGSSDGESILSRKELELDKLVLRLLQISCKEGKYAKSVMLAAMIKREQALEAAAKIALRLEMSSLAQKIEKMREERLEIQV